jgi:hypothetical protein
VVPAHDPDKLYVAGFFQVVDKQNADIFLPGLSLKQRQKNKNVVDMWQAFSK